ncbi:MAG: hypothetical protein DME21_05030 [Verrucomicrobia bacterium]|nr:MAG: hypothetical protein DME21_05030 [Verrucomicrobiota bacterium]
MLPRGASQLPAVVCFNSTNTRERTALRLSGLLPRPTLEIVDAWKSLINYANPRQKILNEH